MTRLTNPMRKLFRRMGFLRALPDAEPFAREIAYQDANEPERVILADIAACKNAIRLEILDEKKLLRIYGMEVVREAKRQLSFPGEGPQSTASSIDAIIAIPPQKKEHEELRERAALDLFVWAFTGGPLLAVAAIC